MLKLSTKSLKGTVVLDPAALAGVIVPNGVAKFPITLAVAGRVLQADLNAKSLRRCVAAINEVGPGGVSVILQGKLDGDTLLEAGIVAQPKAPKPEVSPAPAAQ